MTPRKSVGVMISALLGEWKWLRVRTVEGYVWAFAYFEFIAETEDFMI